MVAESTEISVSEGPQGLALETGRDLVGDISALLLGDGRHARQRLAAWPADACRVANDENVWALRNCEISPDDRATGPGPPWR